MTKNRIIPALGLIALIPLVAWAQIAGSRHRLRQRLGVPRARHPLRGRLPGVARRRLVPLGPPGAAGGTRGSCRPSRPPRPRWPSTTPSRRCRRSQSVSADIVQKVEMLSQHFELKGQYLKGPSGIKVYLKLTLTGLGDSPGTMLQVCDGETLWDYQQLLNDGATSRSRSARSQEDGRSPDFDPDVRKQVLEPLRVRRPEALLIGLRKTIKFDRKEAATLDGRPVWILSREMEGSAARSPARTSRRCPPRPRCRPTFPAWRRSGSARTTAGPTRCSSRAAFPRSWKTTRQIGTRRRPDRPKGIEAAQSGAEPHPLGLRECQAQPRAAARAVRTTKPPARMRRWWTSPSNPDLPGAGRRHVGGAEEGRGGPRGRRAPAADRSAQDLAPTPRRLSKGSTRRRSRPRVGLRAT